MVENQCAAKIKTLRTDSGREYLSKELTTFLFNNGIIHQMSSPEQNGVAEQINCTIIEHVRCMLIDSGKICKKFGQKVPKKGTACFLIKSRVEKKAGVRTKSGVSVHRI